MSYNGYFMKKTTIIKPLFVLLLFHAYCLLVSAQQAEADSFAISILKRREYPLNIKEQFRQDLLSPSVEANKPLMLTFPLRYETPKYEIPAHNLNLDHISYLPYRVYALGDNTLLYMSHTNDFMSGMATVNNINAGLRIQPTENWHINISNSAYKYRDFTGIYNDYTINASSYISLSDNFGINVFGSYSTQAVNNTISGAMPYSPFAPYSYYGGSVEFRVTDKFGIEAGMIRQFNTWTRRWENMYYMAPKFYK